LGHAHPDVVAAVSDQASKGTSYGMTSPLEIELGETIVKAVRSLEMVRFVSSGTEAAMSAVRLARAFAGRDMVIKFEGCYHGHSDGFLSEAGSGLATLGISACPGVPEAFASLTQNTPFNDLNGVEKLFKKHANKIAAIIVEPVAANMGVVAPAPGFLEGLREITKREGALLIFDEVITGFRMAYGGAQEVYRIDPDLTVMGKIIGGGLPVAAYGGKREIMERVAPLGPVYQAGTLSGNPLAMRAGLAMLPKLQAPGFYEDLNRKTLRLAEGLRSALRDAGVEGVVNVAGSLLTIFFSGGPIRDYGDAKKSNTATFGRFFQEMLRRGIFLPPSQFEALFVSAAHTNEEIDQTIAAARASLAALANN
jgi:glutamate-1-semialdehyde 2,1-aminomutase